MEINNKFIIGQKVYLLELKLIKYDCPVCNSKGNFYYNGFDIVCPKCKGSGKIEDKNNRLYSVKPEPCEITGIRSNTYKKTALNMEGAEEYLITTFRYNTTGGKRAENRIFSTLDEAIAACEKLNKEIKNG